MTVSDKSTPAGKNDPSFFCLPWSYKSQSCRLPAMFGEEDDIPVPDASALYHHGMALYGMEISTAAIAEPPGPHAIYPLFTII